MTRVTRRDFLLLAGAVGILHWLLRFFLFSWLCPPFYFVMSLPFSLLGDTVAANFWLGLFVSVLNSAVWGTAISVLAIACQRYGKSIMNGTDASSE